jgi:peptidoglycan LD-endopeptidase LytH
MTAPQVRCCALRILGIALFFTAPLPAPGQLFHLPTANRALFDRATQERYYVGTVGRTWTSGTFGCVRSDGWQLHEGIDIACLQRDKQGEPIDPILATADGSVVYINAKPSLSNYGSYIVLRHDIEGMEIYSLYAHLREVRRDLKVGQHVKAGETIGTMGRTANTREGISKERAHLHFELNLLMNDRFTSWYQKTFPGARNDHGNWNGQNLTGLDVRLILLRGHYEGERFSLLRFLRAQTELCRVQVRETNFSFLKRYAPLIRPNPVADKEGIAGYEIALDYAGAPFELIPRAVSELKGKARFHLLSVNEAEQRKNPCRRLVVKKGGEWELAQNGIRVLELMTY